MPTAKFEADFSSFLTATDAAMQKVTAFGGETKNVEQQLTDMTSKFSGRQIVEEATLMTVAIDKIGGVSKLTAAELEEVGNKAQAAAEKMRALGYDVPEGLQKLADATKANTEATSGWSTVLQTAAGVLGGLGLEAAGSKLVEFATAVIDSGTQIEIMSQKTGISTDNIQRLQYVAGQTGTSMQSMTTAAQMLNEKIGASDKNLIKALDDLGISFEHIQSLDPYTAFTEVADAIGKIHDPTRQAADAQEAFGRAWKELLPAMKAGMKETGEDATVMSEQTVKALHDMETAWAKFKQIVLVAGGETVATAGEMGTAVGTTTDRIATMFSTLGRQMHAAIMAAGLDDAVRQELEDPLRRALDVDDQLARTIGHGFDGLPKALEPVTMSVGQVNDAIDKLNKGPMKEIQKADEQWAALLDRMQPMLTSQQAVIDSIAGSTVEAAKAYLALGRSASDVEQYLGLNKAQMEAIVKLRKDDADAIKAQQKAQDDLVKTTQAGEDAMQKKQAEVDDAIAKEYTDSTTYQINKIWEKADADKIAYEQRYGYSADYNKAVDDLADAQTNKVMDAYAKQAAAADAAAQKQINDALAVATTWGQVVDIMAKAAGVTVVGQRPGEAGSELATVGMDRGTSSRGLTGLHPGGSVGGTGQVSGANTDPRVVGLMSQGYTAGEAAAIVGGYGGMISIPVGQRQTALAQAGGLGAVNITINGSVLSDKNAIAKSVSDALTYAYRNQGYTLPGR